MHKPLSQDTPKINGLGRSQLLGAPGVSGSLCLHRPQPTAAPQGSDPPQFQCRLGMHFNTAEGENVISLLLRIELQRTNCILPSSYISFIKAAEVSPTLSAEVIHQNEFLDQVRRRPAEDAVHGAQEGRPHLIHKAHDDAGGREVVVDLLLGAPATATRAHRGWPVTLLTICRLCFWENVRARGKCPM